MEIKQIQSILDNISNTKECMAKGEFDPQAITTRQAVDIIIDLCNENLKDKQELRDLRDDARYLIRSFFNTPDEN